MRTYLNFIEGEWRAAKSAKTFQTVNPADKRETVAEYPLSGKADASEAIEAAKKSFPGWSAMTPVARGRILSKASQILESCKAELAELPPEEAREYLASYGLNESGLERMITASYRLLGLMSFLTAGETEVRAWTVPIASTAVKAAGAIHSDFEKKFIRAEVVNWEKLVELGGYPGVREKGLLRLEGKEYVVNDGDVLVIRHG